MSNIDLARKFYSLPRISPQDRAEILKMFGPDVRYVGVGKEVVEGRAALEKLWQAYDPTTRGITKMSFDIRHIAENGNAVLLDMVDSFEIDGRTLSGVFSIVFEFEDGLITFWQEHYPLTLLPQAG